ncbi:ABC transporter ATP-binding protein [Leptolinea tardivitalis]|uniref:Heme ABC transporter ATP-binding protein n=1 Tax=Leptolinea tardivitalis TaxID=229920 RepID=A0A0P6XCF3_9CHLR|nr:ABC transporter ATP-binding protein [Leptolinea tardivitalis]KPL72540.1 heme ABC transporter ATP-binding protein [Leptolinea tardivitalis]GAP21162.1 nucleoside ABC transporter ATP-binding protein [Leptolinea tardivitalis]
MDTVLEVKGITKKFPGVLANDHVDFNLRKGEIHALLGENGAGKSTLMNIIYGLTSPDDGEILINGKATHFHSPKDAIACGIGMVHQHFMLVPVFTVAENIMLGSEKLRNGVLDIVQVNKDLKELSTQYGLEIDPTSLVHDLPVGIQQRVEIIKALYRKAEILILDEPTAVLTPQEVEDLFIIIRKLVDQGISVIFITHKLKEVLSIADRITVMRGGKVIATDDPKQTNEQALASQMVGRTVILKVDKTPAKPGDVVLSVKDLHVQDDRKIETVRGVSFEVRKGEILGIAGVQGNGQTELAEAMTGLRHAISGEIRIQDQNVFNHPPRDLVEKGMGHIPEDRQKHGFVMQYPISDNLVLCSYYVSPFCRRGVLQNSAIGTNAENLIKRFDIRTPSPYVPTSKLSGGNQQKVIVARELSRNIKFLVANQPTRGLDVGSIEYIHHEIVQMRDEGIGVVLISAELDEIMALSDRIAVMYHGEIVAILPADKVTREELGLMMAGSLKPEVSTI